MTNKLMFEGGQGTGAIGGGYDYSNLDPRLLQAADLSARITERDQAIWDIVAELQKPQFSFQHFLQLLEEFPEQVTHEKSTKPAQGVASGRDVVNQFGIAIQGEYNELKEFRSDESWIQDLRPTYSVDADELIAAGNSLDARSPSSPTMQELTDIIQRLIDYVTSNPVDQETPDSK